MKQYLVALMVVGLAGAAQANEKVTLSGVHNCCGGCAAGITKAVGSIPGVTSTLDGDKVSLDGADNDSLQKAVNALLTAGYTGTSDNAAVKVAPVTGPDEKVTSLTITGTHMCCGSCVKAAKAAVKSVAGVQSDTIAPHAESFKVEGDFNAKDLMSALAKAGFTGQITK